jgi:hypothetical protein
MQLWATELSYLTQYATTLGNHFRQPLMETEGGLFGQPLMETEGGCLRNRFIQPKQVTQHSIQPL